MDVQISLKESRAERISRRFLSGLGSLGAVMALAMVLAGCGGTTSDGGTAGNTTTSLTMAQKYTVDGTVDFSAFTTVNSEIVTINSNFGAEGGMAVQPDTELRWVMDNDDRNLYVALEWRDITRNNSYDLNNGPTDYDGIRVLFDGDGDGTFAEGEDMRTLIAASIGSIYTDQHYVTAGDSADLIGDGYGKLTYNAVTQKYQAELLLPMSQDAEGQDGALSSTSKFNFAIYDNVTPATGNAGYAYGNTLSTGAWPALALKSEAGFSHPAIPGGLTGRVAFISEQHAPVGEVYTMNLATGQVMRVTVHTNLYKDKVALSHDRTRIAFEGVLCNFAVETLAACKQRTNDYEIYRVDVAGVPLTQLTNNATRDAHPGWSADDQFLVFTSFRNGDNGAVVITDADGAELADLSGAGDDRDPDFLADGRIVFATNRFYAGNETRIAVMNADGSGVVQLSYRTGVTSDHAPFADATKVIFEQFTKDTDPATDVESLFVPWNLAEVELAGSTVSTFLSDGWVNRQPVFDPSGKYVAYLKNTGYNAAHLIGRDGTQYGRFIPNITGIRSLDWK